MPKRKTVDAEVTPVADSPAKRTSAAKPKASAATHKRAAKKSTPETPVAAVPAVAVSPEVSNIAAPELLVVAPSQPAPTVSREDIARRAYALWEARGRHEGDPEQDWLAAERQLFELAQNR